MAKKAVLVIIYLVIASCSTLCFAEKTRINPYLGYAEDDSDNGDNLFEINADCDLGGASYKEEEGTIESDWNAFYARLSASAGSYDEDSFEGGVEFGIFVTATDTESWDIGNTKYQTNDMDFWGIDFLVEGGWAINVGDTGLTITPLAGYGYKLIKYSRTNFNILNIITSTDVVDEDHSVHHLDIGGKIDYKLNDQFNFYGKGRFGFVISNKADNSVAGKIDGGGGYIVNAEVGINVYVTKNSALNLSGFADLQHLNGGSATNVIWPDNDLNIYGGTLGLKYAF